MFIPALRNCVIISTVLVFGPKSNKVSDYIIDKVKNASRNERTNSADD